MDLYHITSLSKYIIGQTAARVNAPTTHCIGFIAYFYCMTEFLLYVSTIITVQHRKKKQQQKQQQQQQQQRQPFCGCNAGDTMAD